MESAVPVLMYHSIAPFDPASPISHLSIDPELFEDQIASLGRHGYISVSLHDLYDYVRGTKKILNRSIVLTFDDGYLDNWVFALPILKKYGFKGTVFVSTDFIDQRGQVHSTLEDVWQGKIARQDLQWKGFLSIEEMRRMISSGVMNVECHCKSHTMYFAGRDIVDFHHPGDGFHWLSWNAKPERKYLYLEEDQSGFVPLGMPIYSYSKALEARVFFPDPDVDRRIADFVDAHGGKGFFDNPKWKEEIFSVASRLRGEAKLDRYETDEERRKRYLDEIVGSKKYLEECLGKPLDFLCWPAGGYDDLAVEIARDAGFKAWTIRSSQVRGQKNRPGDDPRWIRRIAVVPWWIYKGRKICPMDGDFLLAVLRDYLELPSSGIRLKWLKITRLVKSLTS